MAVVAEHIDLQCYHCGQDCPDHSRSVQDKYFCCEGCKTVYEILNEGGLNQYYTLEPTPGISLRSKRKVASFDYLDDEMVSKQLLDFDNGEISRVTFRIPQIHCASCIHLLERLHQLHAGVVQSRVNFVKQQASITFHPKEIPLSALVMLLDTLGYTPEINLGSSGKEQEPRVNRSFYYRLGVAGFCFGNIMLFSFPEYLSIDPLVDGAFAEYFSYLNLLLALPVLLYSSAEFFTSAYKGIRARHFNLDVPISLGILVLFSRSAYEILSQTGAGYMDSLAGLVFFLLIGRWFQRRTYQQLSFERDYKSYFPIAITRVDNGTEAEVPLANLSAGDQVLIRNEEIIPADGILQEGEASIDYSFVTGESEPVSVEQGGTIYAGGRQLGSSIQVQLTHEVSQSYLTGLWNDQAFATKAESGLSTLADQVAKYFTPAILLIATVSAGIWATQDVSKAIQVFTAVLIVACPCALALSAPFTLGNAQRVLGRAGMYLKNIHVLEKLGKVKALVLDKTGTLTLQTQHQISYNGHPITSHEQVLVKNITRQSGHPLSKMIYQSLEGNEVLSVAYFKEIPGKGIEGLVEGKVIQAGSAAFVGPTDELSSEGSEVWISIDGEVKGRFNIKAPYREGLQKVVQRLGNNYELSLISGDNNKQEQVLREYFGADVPMLFQQSPKDKLEYVKRYQADDKPVIMIGDGLNDAGALKQSNVGIAVSDDINNFSPACDAILHGRSFGDLPVLLGYGRVSVKLVYAAFAISLLYNVVGLGFAVQGLLSPLVAAILMPLSSITVVAFGTLATWAAAWRMGLNIQGSDKGHPPF